MCSYFDGRTLCSLVNNGMTRRDANGVRSYDAPKLHVYLLDAILLDAAEVELYFSLDGTP